MKVTIVDIAKKLNITPSTVSRALADNERVSKKTRELVKQTAIEMGYKPNVMAASLRKGTTNVIGMVVPRINRHFFSNVICGVEEILNTSGYSLTIIQSNEKYEREIQAIDSLLKSRVAGIIISHSIETQSFSHMEKLVDQLPLVQFDRVNDALPGPKVVNNNYQGAYEATQQLIQQGYTKLVHLTGNDHTQIYRDRKQGFLAALKDAKMDASGAIIINDVLTRDAGYKAINKLLDQYAFDAIFSAGDYAALGAIEALKEANVTIPEEVGVIGFGNEPFAELIHPSMSTIDQQGEIMGHMAAEAMLKRLEIKDANQIKVVPVKVKWRHTSNRK